MKEDFIFRFKTFNVSFEIECMNVIRRFSVVLKFIDTQNHQIINLKHGWQKLYDRDFGECTKLLDSAPDRTEDLVCVRHTQ